MATDPGMLGDWYKSYMDKPPKAASYAATTAGTTNWNVDKNQTAQGQLDGILNKDGVLMQQAATRAKQEVSGRGLLNSSLGIQAGQSALYDAATPIATNDANTYAKAAETNATEANRAAIENARFTNDATKFNTQATNDFAMNTFNEAGKWGLEDKRQEFTTKENATQRDFTTKERVAGETFTAGENTAQRDFQVKRDTIQNDFNARLQELQEQGADVRQSKLIASNEAMDKLKEAGVTNRFDAQQALQSKQFDFEQNAIDRRTTEGYAARLKEMGYANELNKAEVPSQYAAGIASSTMAAINQILGDPNLDPASKKGAIDNVVASANSTMKWASTFYGVAFPDISAPGGTAGATGTNNTGTGPGPQERYTPPWDSSNGNDAGADTGGSGIGGDGTGRGGNGDGAGY